MLTKLNLAQFKYFYFFFLSIVLFSLFANLISQNHLLNYDDPVLISPIKVVHSFSQYWKLHGEAQILDVQPIRDISYLITLKLSNYIPWFNFHFVNLLLWFFSTILIFEIIYYFTQNIFLTAIFTTLIAVSPISTSSIAWVSAQKHILSTLFTLLLTFLSIKLDEETMTLRKSFVFAVIFNLAIYSHPINLLWPVWLFVFLLLRKNSVKKILYFEFPLIISGVVCFYFNSVYYATTFVQGNAGVDKFDPELAQDFGARLLAIGRYVFVSVFTFDSLPSPHYVGSIQNILGLGLLVIFLIICYNAYKKKKDLLPSLFLLYFFIPLVPVTYKITRVFCSDTYVLNSYIGILLLIAYCLKDFESKILKTVLVIYVLGLGIQNSKYVKIFNDNFELWKYSYLREATPDSALMFARMLQEQKKFGEAELIIRRVHDWEPDNLNLYAVAVSNVFSNPATSIDYKVKRLSNFIPQKPISHLYLLILHANLNNKEKVQRESELVLSDVPSFLFDLGGQKDKAIGTYLGICEKFKIESCESNFLRFKKYFKNDSWNYVQINKIQKNIVNSSNKVEF